MVGFVNIMVSDKAGMPLRIAFVIPSFYGGGAERSVLRLAKGLIDRGHSVDILVFSQESQDGHLTYLIPSEANLFLFDNPPPLYFKRKLRL